MGEVYSVQEGEKGLVYRDALENIEAPIPEAVRFAGLLLAEEPPAGDADALLERALANPHGCPRLSELAKGRKTAGIMVSDATRAVATARVLPHVVGELLNAGLSLDDIVIVVAIGVHRPATEKEMLSIAGEYAGRIRVENHDPYDRTKLANLGVTSYGTAVEVNKTICDSDLRIAIGKVEPHEFAGFSGGRKSVLPGVAGERTILVNHRPEMILDPNAAPGVLENNPIHLDMLEAAKLLGVDFCVNLVQNSAGLPLAAFAGDLAAAHAVAVAFARRNYGAALPSDANLYLVTPGAPLNIDLYQSIKPLIALFPVLRKGDVVVLYSECREGVQSDDMLTPFEHGPSIDAIMRFLSSNYRIQMDHALLLCKLYQKGVDVIASSPGVDDGVFTKMLMRPAPSVAAALLDGAGLIAARGEKPVLCVFPMAQRMIL